ncbi:MAG: serine/threonine-protein kinase [Planctomycetota bacterium]
MDNTWLRAKELFQNSLELPASERDTYLREQGADETEREQVMDMLRTHDSEPEFLESPLKEVVGDDTPVRDPLIGHTIGQFCVRHRLGRGGSGAVYEATQVSPNRRVAIKVLRSDQVVSPTDLSRFQSEADILARLQHPNIAHVYASGTFGDNEGRQPWFAMELVEGHTLKQHMRNHQLDERSCLDLFLKVCDGLSHAHSREVVHRDLKPANILIPAARLTEPKVVDFGIAKITADSGRAMTATNGVLGTLDYLSPEQLGLGSTDVDHRSDVYSLGVILFEMLAGRLPHERRAESIAALMAHVADETPIPLRQMDRRFSRDIETILSKALAAEPARRYQSVEAMTDDVYRYLGGQPIAARPPSTGYRLKKYLARNRILVAGTASTIVALLCGLVGFAWSAGQAREAAKAASYEAEKAVAVSSFVTNDFLVQLLNEVRAIEAGQPADVGELIRASSARIDAMYADDPLIEAAVRNEVGTLFYQHQYFGEAAGEYSRAKEIWENGLGLEHPDTLKATHNLGQAFVAEGRSQSPKTLDLCRRAFEGRERILGLQHEATIRSLNNLAEVYRAREMPAEAEALFLRGMNAQIGTTSQAITTRLALAYNLGRVYADQERFDEALALHCDSYALAKKHLGTTHPTSLSQGIRYAQTLYKARRLDTARDVLEPIIVEYKRLSSKDPAGVNSPSILLARVYRRQGNIELARRTLDSALECARLDEEKYDLQIRTIRRDLRRLDEGE